MAEFYNSLFGDSDWEEVDIPSGVSPRFLFPGKTKRTQKCGPPVLLEEDERGLGFWGNLYCPYCGQGCDFILIEFDHRCASPSSLRTEIDLREWGENFMKCPRCGYGNMELIRK